MRLRNVTGSREMIAGSRFVVHEPAAQKGKWCEVFGNDCPIHIEIGMGKGRFMMELAAANPRINYVGIEKYSTVLLRAVQKMEAQGGRGDLRGVWQGRGGADLPELLRSLAEGQACQETSPVAAVSSAVR